MKGKFEVAKHCSTGAVVATVSALLAAMTVLPAQAASVSTSGTVTSGSSSYTTFATQRKVTGSGGTFIRQNSSTPAQSGMRYHLVRCETGAIITDPYLFANDGQTTRTVSLKPTTCFQIQARRDSPADTNGIWQGSGNTTFNITVTWP